MPKTELIFRKIELSHAELFRTVCLRSPCPTCDYTLGGVLLWRDSFCMEYAQEGDALFIRQLDTDGRRCYLLPFAHNMKAAISRITDEADKKCLFWGVPEEYLHFFDGMNAEIQEQRDFFDYVYDAKAFVSFEGKKLKMQRNHLNHFIKNTPNWHYEPLTSENVKKTLAYFENSSTDELSASENPFGREDTEKIREALTHNDIYGFSGGILYENDSVIGFTMGEIKGNMLCVHIEKAEKAVTGAFQMLAKLYAQQSMDDYGITLINREDDMGDMGLRLSKTAYNPLRMLRKYLVEIRD